MVNFLGYLPGYAVPKPLDFSPIQQAIESNQQNALAQRRLNLEDQRFGLEKQRFGLQERDSNLAYQNALARKGEYDKLMSDPNSPIARDPTIAAAARIAGYENAPSIIVQGRNADLERQRIQLQARQVQAQLDQIKMQTPAWRAANAQTYGIDPASEEGKAFIITGQYTPKLPQFIHLKPGETAGFADPRKGTYTPIDLGAAPTQGVFDNKYAGENAPKLYDESSKAYRDSINTAQTADDLMLLSKYASTGFGAEGLLHLRKMASAAGIPASEKIAPTELFRMLTQKYVLTEAQKLKPLSNSDVEFVNKGLATVQTDPSSIPVVMPALQQEALRNARYHQLAMEAYRRGKPADPVALEAQVDKEMPSVIRQMFGPQQGQQGAAPPQAGQPGQQPTAPKPQLGAIQPGMSYDWTPQGLRPSATAPPTSEGGAPAPAAGQPSDVQRGVDAMNRRRAAAGQPEMPPPPQTPQVGQRMAMDAIALRDGKMPPQAFIQRYANAHRQGALSPAERAMYEEIVQAVNRQGSP